MATNTMEAVVDLDVAPVTPPVAVVDLDMAPVTLPVVTVKVSMELGQGGQGGS